MVSCCWAHPHGCGEHDVYRLIEKLPEGSSPRVWGTQGRSSPDVAACGLIPTGVGNTEDYAEQCIQCQAHPHGCGEHSNRRQSIPSRLGSSPRVWGTPEDRAEAAARDRLIPTGVGNTKVVRGCVAHCWAHPHGCGEHALRVVARGALAGSSPRVWGTRPYSQQKEDRHRLIPTGVGNTSKNA